MGFIAVQDPPPSLLKAGSIWKTYHLDHCEGPRDEEEKDQAGDEKEDK